MPDVSQSDPAEGSREVIDRELERHRKDQDVPAAVNKRRRVRAVKTDGADVPAKILRAHGPRNAKPRS